ncbi:MAG: hypothetical protein ACYCP0_04270 [Acidiferrobacteraceae bacterium]
MSATMTTDTGSDPSCSIRWTFKRADHLEGGDHLPLFTPSRNRLLGLDLVEEIRPQRHSQVKVLLNEDTACSRYAEEEMLLVLSGHQPARGLPGIDADFSPWEEAAFRECGAGDGAIADFRKAGGYRTILSSSVLRDRYQDMLDHFLQHRLIDVRNHLRQSGWTGDYYGGPLSRTLQAGGQVTLAVPAVHEGAGRNLVQLVFSIAPGTPTSASRPPKWVDAMDRSASALAHEINESVLCLCVDVAPDETNSGGHRHRHSQRP